MVTFMRLGFLRKMTVNHPHRQMCETRLKFLHRKLSGYCIIKRVSQHHSRTRKKNFTTHSPGLVTSEQTSKQSSTNTVSGGHSQCLCVSGGCDDSPNAHKSELQASPLSMGFKVKDTRLRYWNDKRQRRILIFLALIFKPFFCYSQQNIIKSHYNLSQVMLISLY